MKYSDIGFRGIYHNLFAVTLTKNLLPIVKGYPDIDKADHLLVYGYIDHEAGLTLEVLAGGKKGRSGFRFFDTNVSVKGMIRIGAVTDNEFYYFEDKSGDLKKRYSEKIQMLSAYDVAEEIEQTRHMEFLDASRHPEYPDDVQVILTREGLQPEACWVRIAGLGEHWIMGNLLNEPNQDFDYHNGELIAFFVHENEDKSVICYSNMTPSAKLTEEDLEDGSMLKNAVATFEEERTEPHFLDILEILRDSYVWIPCNAVISDTDQARFEALVAEAGDDIESLIGQEMSNQDAIRFIPDILQNGDNFFFPVFSSAEEMGEYGSHFSKVQKHMLEAISLARNNDKKVSGIVLNAFSQPFVLDSEIFDIVERMKYRL